MTCTGKDCNGRGMVTKKVQYYDYGKRPPRYWLYISECEKCGDQRCCGKASK